MQCSAVKYRQCSAVQCRQCSAVQAVQCVNAFQYGVQKNKVLVVEPGQKKRGGKNRFDKIRQLKRLQEGFKFNILSLDKSLYFMFLACLTPKPCFVFPLHIAPNT